MHRLTTNKDVSEMSMYELAHNACYSKDGLARYRDFEMDMDARDFARKLMTTTIGYDLPEDDDVFDEEIMENLQYDPFKSVTGLVALFYRNLWAMADLRETLKAYEDEKERGGWIPCSERLPDRNNPVLCWVTSTTISSGETYIIGSCDNGFWFLQTYEIGHHHFPVKDYKVVAWQPLPAPYKQKGE